MPKVPPEAIQPPDHQHVEGMHGMLSFTPGQDEDPDPMHGRFTDPNAVFQMTFSGVLSELSTTLVGMTADIGLAPTPVPGFFYSWWSLTFPGSNGHSMFAYASDSWQDDSVQNLSRLKYWGSGEFEYRGSYTVYGPLSSVERVQSVPEPSTMALFGLGLVGLTWGRMKQEVPAAILSAPRKPKTVEGAVRETVVSDVG